MSKLSELIRKFCTNGVEYKPLCEVLKIRNGKDYKGFSEGDVPVYGSGGIMTYIDTFAYDKPSVLIPRKGSIDKLYYVDTPFWTVDTIFYTVINTDIVIPKFVFYYLQKQHLEQFNTAGGVPSLTQTVLYKVKIPVPHLEVQAEIVKILDNFTELTAELTARKKQYEYYSNKLLTFENQKYEVKKIADVVSISRGKRLVRSQLSENGKYPVYQNSMTPLGYYEESNCLANTAFIISAGAAGEIGYSYEDFWAADDCLYFTCPKEINSRYLYYLLLTQQTNIISQVRRASVPRLSRSVIENLGVVVPPVDVQERIVNVLDNFDAICSDLNIGLPAEIEARQKQYEYYRDKLLSFKEI